MSFAQETFEAFKAISAARGLSTKVELNDHTLHRLEHWAHDFIFAQYHLPDEPYDYALVLQPSFRNKTSKHRSNYVQAYVLALNSSTGVIKVLSRNYVNKFDTLKKPESVAGIIRNAPHDGYRVSGDLNEIDHGIAYTLSVAVESIIPRLIGSQRAVKTNSFPYYERWLKDLVRSELRAWFVDRFERTLQDFKSLSDEVSLEFAVSHCTRTKDYKPHSSLYVYNHIVAAPTGVTRDFRRGAISILQPLSYFFYDDASFWTAIDNGTSIYETLAQKFNVKSATVKRFIRNNIYLQNTISEEEAAKYLPYLDVTDPALWPNSSAEAKYFKYLVDCTIAYRSAFKRDIRQAMQDMTREISQSAQNRWELLFNQRFNRQKLFLERTRMKGRQRLSNRARKRLPAVVKDKDIVDQFIREMNNIGDMHSDIRRRVMLPLLVVESEAQGFEVLKLASLEGMAVELEQRLWSKSPPSEQVAASAYWHSTRVNFQQRFESVAYTTTDACWKTLIDKPYEIKNRWESCYFHALSI